MFPFIVAGCPSLPTDRATLMRGAYGLQVLGVDDPEGLGKAPQTWSPITVRQEIRDDFRVEGHRVEEGVATVALTERMAAVVDRDARTATLVSDVKWPAASLTHPFLAAPGALFAWWEGRAALHGGAVVGAAGAWALVAEKGGGKSTTMARLSRDGVPVVADDLVVVDDGAVLAGPRCIDLAEDDAQRLGVDGVRREARHDKVRLLLPPVEPATPLAGIVRLAWGDEVEVVPVPLADRPALVMRNLMLWPTGMTPRPQLALMALPAYELRRPRGLGSLDRAVDALLRLDG